MTPFPRLRHAPLAHRSRWAYARRKSKFLLPITGEAIPAFVTMMVTPFPWLITNGIGRGYVTYAAVGVFDSKRDSAHRMAQRAAAAFVADGSLPLL